MNEFFLDRGSFWLVLMLLLVCFDFLLKDRLYLTMVALAAFLVAVLAKLGLPVLGQAAFFAASSALFLWKLRAPVQRWREETNRQSEEAIEDLRSRKMVVVQSITSPNVPGRVLVDDIVVPARSRNVIFEGAEVQVVSAGPSELWVAPRKR